MALNQNLSLRLEINLPPIKANGHGHRKTIDLSEQLTSYALK